CFGPGIGVASMLALAVLPVHALYAGFELRESLVVFLAVLTVWGLVELVSAGPRLVYFWAIVLGVCGWLAILARHTSLVLLAVSGIWALIVTKRGRLLPLLLWVACVCAVITPWAWSTWQEYGEPFFTYTKYYPFNFSWAVHHFDRGNTRPEQFFVFQN